MANHKFTINGRTFDVCVESIGETNARVNVNGTPYDVVIERDVQEDSRVTAGTQGAASAPKAPAPATASGRDIKSPLPGVILEICVREGQSVKRGQKLLVLEAMKMENEVQAECDGTVKGIQVQKGDSVLEGAKLLTIG